MKKSLLGLTFASLMFSAGSAVAADYKIDKEGQHAFVNFRIQHLGYSWLYGTFKDFDGTFTFDEKNPAADKVNVTINTLNGVTKPVTLEAKLIGQGDDPWGGKRAGFEAEGKIKLKDFNIKTDLGPASQEVDLIISVEGVQQK